MLSTRNSLILCLLLIILGNAAAAQRHGRSSRSMPQRKAMPVLDQKTKDEILRIHNEYRQKAGVPALEWSDELSAYAQQWADYLTKNGCVMKHRPQDGSYKQVHGENLYMATIGFYSVADGIADWYNEKRLYNGDPISGSNFHAVGHYTQLMWANTTKLGAGIAYCNGNFILVCNYDPPGNVMGQTPF